MNKLLVDLDETLAFRPNGEEYSEALPDIEMIEHLRRWRTAGFQIVIYTARNMRTFDGDVDMIRKHTLPIILEWLAFHAVPYDDIYLGKPWPGPDGYYIDDRAITPDAFKAMRIPEVES